MQCSEIDFLRGLAGIMTIFLFCKSINPPIEPQIWKSNMRIGQFVEYHVVPNHHTRHHTHLPLEVNSSSRKTSSLIRLMNKTENHNMQKHKNRQKSFWKTKEICQNAKKEF